MPSAYPVRTVCVQALRPYHERVSLRVIMWFEIPTIYFHYVDVSVLIQFLLKTSVFLGFFISVIINLHKIIDRRCVLESSRQSDSNTRSQHMISWRNIEKKITSNNFDTNPHFTICKDEILGNFCTEMFPWCKPARYTLSDGGLTGLVVKSVGLHRETRVRSSAGSVCCFLEQETFTPQKYWWYPGIGGSVSTWLKNCLSGR